MDLIFEQIYKIKQLSFALNILSEFIPPPPNISVDKKNKRKGFAIFDANRSKYSYTLLSCRTPFSKPFIMVGHTILTGRNSLLMKGIPYRQILCITFYTKTKNVISGVEDRCRLRGLCVPL